MQLRITSFAENHTAGRQYYLSSSQMLVGMMLANFNILVPGFSSCCDGCSSCSTGW
jgi:hypothetical protein